MGDNKWEEEEEEVRVGAGAGAESSKGASTGEGGREDLCR